MNLLRKTICVIICICYANNAMAMRLIIDEETEEVLTEITNPIFKAAQLQNNNLKINIVQDESINAFVIDNQNVFVFTGLLTFSKNPEVIAGVVAHECAHIALGHIASQGEEMKIAQMQMIASTLIGAAAGVLSGDFGAFGAVMAGGAHASHMHLLKHSRFQESQADAAAVIYLKKVNLAPDGLIELLKHLNSHERIFLKESNPYLLTHPISKERIKALKQFQISPTNHISKNIQERYEMVVAKVFAFTSPSDVTFKKYKGNRAPDLYAQAIAYYKVGQLSSALKIVDELIRMEPKNPYFIELKAQFLYENGKVKDSVVYYEQSLSLKPTSQILQMELALALITANISLPKAIKLLRSAIDHDKKNFVAWHSLGIALEKNNQHKYSLIALARAYAIIDDETTAQKFIQRSEQNPDKIQNTFYQEILEETKIMLKKK